jgi:hypothetical protein
VLGIAVTISSGTWIVGVPQLVRETFDRGAGGFSLLVAAYAAGSIAAGLLIARHPARNAAFAGLFAWTLYLPAYGIFAFAGSLWPALVGAVAAGAGQGSALVLVTSAAQTSVPDHLLGRVMGLISLVHRGAHATGLAIVAPLFIALSPPTVFAGAALALPLVGIGGAVAALTLSGRALR